VKYRVLRSAARRIEEIYHYTSETWGQRQAKTYIDGLFRCFDSIAQHNVVWKLIPAKYGVEGYYCRFEKHCIFWKELPSGHIGIAAILHDKMDHIHLLTDDFRE
jgi:toxin ParE1/3/4